MSVKSIDITVEDHIGTEQAKALYGRMAALLVATPAGDLLVVAVLSQHFSLKYLLLWALSGVVVIISSWLVTRKFTPETTSTSNYRKRLNIFTFLFAINGLRFGMVGVFFHDPSMLFYTLYLLIVLSAYVSVSLSSTSLHFPAFIAFSFPAIFCFILPLALEGEGIYLWLALSAPVYLVVMTFFARSTENDFKSAKSIEFENLSLLNQVTEEKNRAEIAVSDKNQFLAAISHDLRQPLHAMNLYIDALDPRLADPLDKSILEKIAMSGSALNDLLHGLLDISRLDANVVENKPHHLVLGAIANELKEEFLPQATESDLDLIVDIDNQHVIYADPVLLERVLRNLLSNAIKYTQKGQVGLSSSLTNSKVKISVSDTGIGVPQDKISSIFSEFTQIGNPERDRNKGVGLGLSIVKRLCDLQDINLLFESQLNKGTQVSLEIKQGDVDLLPLLPSTNNNGFDSLTILCIDDEQTILDGMEMIIRSWKCQPLMAYDGESAMKLIHDLDVTLDLIISDLRLRNEESGIDVIESIREEFNEDTPAIVITGDTGVDRIELVEKSNVALMFKPLKPTDLRQHVQRLLSSVDQT